MTIQVTPMTVISPPVIQMLKSAESSPETRSTQRQGRSQ